MKTPLRCLLLFLCPPIFVGALLFPVTAYEVEEISPQINPFLMLVERAPSNVGVTPDIGLLNNLTLSEREWLQENKRLVFHTAESYKLAELDRNNQKNGFLIDYMALINQKLGSQFELKLHPESKIRHLLQDSNPGPFFGITCEGISENKFAISETILSLPYAFFSAKTKKQIEKMTDLSGQRIGVFDPYDAAAHSTAYERAMKIPDITLLPAHSFKVMFDNLAEGKVDLIYANQLKVQHYLVKNKINDIKLNLTDVIKLIEFKVVIAKEQTMLSSIINKALDSVTKKEEQTLHRRWFANQKIADNRVQFSPREKQWLLDNPVVYFSDFNWMPYVKVGESSEDVEGIAKEYLDLVVHETGLDFQFIQKTSWQDILNSLKNGELNLTLAAGKTPDREKIADFSVPFISSPMAIITSSNYSFVQNLQQLEGMRIAMPKNLFVEEYIRSNYPEIELVYTNTIAEAFDLVAQGGADAYVGNMAVAAYYLRNNQLTNLRISGSIDLELTIHFMLAKGQPELLSIINKIILSVSEEEKRVINNRWFSIQYQEGIDPQLVLKLTLVVSVILAVFLYWVRRLRKEIRLRKLTERSLESARQDAVRANKAKSEFLANMSHEIRTPMNAVVGFTQLLLETDLDQMQRNYLESIKVGSHGLLHIINDILDLSKIEAGKLSIEYHSIDVAKLFDELLKIFESSMNEKGVSFNIELSPSVPKYLYLDGNRVRQILLNLIGNAQKFTEFGSIKVRVSATEVKFDNVSFNLTVEVIDTGIGIAADSLEAIFRNFVQHQNNSVHKYGGTGLGLAISRKLAEKMNGTLTVESELGKGSCFTLQLKGVAVASSVSEQSSSNVNYQFNKAVILLVDDVESNRMIISKYLQAFPFEVVQAKDGVEAIDLALKIKPDLILMDLRMPKMDGYEATRMIKKSIKVPVIALTASALEDEESKEQRKIFDDYLRKPVLKSKLLESLSFFLAAQVVSLDKKEPSVKIEIPTEHIIQFRQIVRARIMTEIDSIGNHGQFEKIEVFAIELIELGNLFDIAGLKVLAEQLLNATLDFDIEKIDLLLMRLRKELKESIEVEV